MNNAEILEWIIVIVSILIQLKVYSDVKRKISYYENMFMRVGDLGVGSYYVSDNDLLGDAKTALIDLGVYYMEHSKDYYDKKQQNSQRAPFENYALKNLNTVELIVQKANTNYYVSKIINVVNFYLFKNKGYASDYAIFKDIIERESTIIKKEAFRNLFLPVFIGILGAVLAIAAVFLVGNNISLSRALASAPAMFAIFSGMLFSLLLYIKYGKADVIHDSYKSGLYSFIQKELLPYLNNNLNTSFVAIQKNLKTLNSDFERNMVTLQTLIDKNFETLRVQSEILSKIEGTDNVQFAKANVMVLQELQITTDRFSEFGRYMDTVNHMLQQSREYTDKINEMIARTDNFNNLGEHILQTFRHNQQLIDFLQQHYNALDHSRQMIYNSVGKVNTTLDESLDNLKIFTQAKIQEIQKLIDHELELIKYENEQKSNQKENPQLSSLTTEIQKLNALLEEKRNQPTDKKSGESSIFRDLFGKK